MPTDGYVFQEKLVTHSSPTLFNMKTGSLFSIYNDEFSHFSDCLDYFNNHLLKYDIHILVLKEDNIRKTIYIYNTNVLKRLFENEKIRLFLNNYGYTDDNIIEHLLERFHEEKCPHEIGIFLGYPLNDVLAFINKKSKCPLIGYWKAYSNIENTKEKFYHYDCCRRLLKTKINNGELIFDTISKVR